MSKVICIKTGEEHEMRRHRVTPPTVGTTYTVRGVVSPPTRRKNYLLLAGLRNPTVRYGGFYAEAGFPEKWFRKVDEDSSEKWTAGADPASAQFDNRRRIKVDV